MSWWGAERSSDGLCNEIVLLLDFVLKPALCTTTESYERGSEHRQAMQLSGFPRRERASDQNATMYLLVSTNR